ncbi:MAG TPA: hypothetical protein VLV28_01810 [Gaiellaceae bacterium]|nr:hypothetical protein [Gaiellaceae bacterium]
MRDLPPPLPPRERTIGQLIAEAIRAYGNRFWRVLPLGLPLAIVDQACAGQPLGAQVLIYWAAAPLFVAAFVQGCVIVYDASWKWTAFGVGLLIYAVFPPLRAAYLIPGLAWFAFIGLAVPAALVERRRFRDALVRGRELGTADYFHALGSLAALVIGVGVAEYALEFLLRSQSDSGLRVAVFLADLVLSPLLYLGGALLYEDQVARVGSPRHQRRRRRHADLHPPLDADTAGRPDPEGHS